MTSYEAGQHVGRAIARPVAWLILHLVPRPILYRYAQKKGWL